MSIGEAFLWLVWGFCAVLLLGFTGLIVAMVRREMKRP